MELYSILAPLYDRLMEETYDYEAWAEYLLKFLPAEGNLLDLGCGTGKLAGIFLDKGYHMTCADVSVEMLSVLYDRLGSHKNLQVLEAAAEEIGTIGSFDAVLMNCDVVNHIIDKRDLKLALRNVYDNLKPGGIFLFDIVTDKKLRDLLGDNTFTEETDDAFIIWQNTWDKPYSESRMTIFAKDGKTWRRHEESQLMRAYSEEELKEMLTKLGFRKIRVLRGFGETVRKENALRLQFVACK